MKSPASLVNMMETHMNGHERSCPPVEGEGNKLEIANDGATKEGAVSIN